MIDETRLITVDTGIDHRLRIDDEKKCMTVIRILALVTAVGLVMRDAFTEILDHSRPLADFPRRKDPQAVHAGTADLER